MKIRSVALTLGIGLIILSVSMLISRPAFGTANIGAFCEFMRNASPILMGASCILILFAATKLRVLGIIGIILIAGSLTITWLLAERTGYSMGTSGWVSGFLGLFVVIPAGLLLCGLTGFLSLIDIMEKDNTAQRTVIISAVFVAILGIAYHVTANWKPDIYSLIEIITSSESEYERFSTASKLLEIKDDRLPPLLIGLFEHDNPRVREAAFVAVRGESRTAAAVSPLLEAFEKETDNENKAWIIRALAVVAPLAEPADRTETVDTLIHILKNETGSIKGTAAESLGYIEDKRAIKPLIEALNDRDAASDAHNALIMITGMRFERDPAVWNQWLAGQSAGSPTIQ